MLRAPTGKILPERNPGGGPMLVVGCGACTLRGPSWASESLGPHLRCGRVLSEWRPRGGPLPVATRGPGPARATVPPLSLQLCTCGRSCQWQWRRQCSAVPDGPHRTGQLEYTAAPSFLRATAVPSLAGWSASSSASCKGPAPEIRGGWTRLWASESLIAQSCGPPLNECTALSGTGPRPQCA